MVLSSADRGGTVVPNILAFVVRHKLTLLSLRDIVIIIHIQYTTTMSKSLGRSTAFRCEYQGSHDIRTAKGSPHQNCPGVMLTSRTMQTTSGVCVQDRTGRQYITAAAHGFDGVGDEVWHSNGNGVHVGNVIRTLGDSDIALVELKEGIKYLRQTFDNRL